jgi:hypothetical protein
VKKEAGNGKGMNYIYTTENNLENRQTYQYSEYGGKIFLKAYADSRYAILDKNKGPVMSVEDLSEMCTDIINKYYQKKANDEPVILRYKLCQVLIGLLNIAVVGKNVDQLDPVLKTFEVRKRLYHCYSSTFKPYDESDYQDSSLYLLFACVLAQAYEKTSNLKYLNALLKVNDTLISIYSSIRETEYKMFFYVLSEEMKAVNEYIK